MKFKSNIEIQAGLEDAGGSPGTVNQLLSSTVTGTAWINPSTIVAEAATLVVIACKNTSGAPIPQGTPVYQTGTVGATATIEIAPADALISANKLPAIGLLQTALNNNGFGFVVITGELTNFTTSPIDGVVPTTGDKIFVKSGGGLTLTKPTGESNGIQNMGLVGKVSTGSAGSITVSSIMRTNDVPNLPEGRIWVGDGNTIVSDTVYVDEPNSRVGIGTDTVNYPLDVRAGLANSDVAQFTGANDSRGLKISTFQTAFSDDSVDYDCQYSGDAPLVPSGVQTWSMDGSEKMRLKQNGNLGVGTTSPITKLEVSSADQTKLRITSTDTSVAQFDSVGTLEFKANDTSPGGNNVVGFVDCIAAADRGDFTTALLFGTSKGGAATEKMRVNPNGDVGIGTSSLTSISIVSTTLSLGSASATTSGGIAFQANDVVKAYSYVASDYLYSQTVTGIGQIFFGAGSEQMRIHNTTGNVGIGTTNPQSKLQVNGGVQLASDTASPSAEKAGTFRYRTSGNNSYVDMCMQTGASTYAWVNIVQNNW